MGENGLRRLRGRKRARRTSRRLAEARRRAAGVGVGFGALAWTGAAFGRRRWRLSSSDEKSDAHENGDRDHHSGNRLPAPSLFCRFDAATSGRDTKRHGHRVELVQDLVCRLRTRGGILGEAAHDERRKRARNSGRHLVQRLRVARELSGERFARRWSGERRHARHQLVGEKPDRIDVHAVIGGRVARQLFGCHVRRRADRDSGGGHATDRHRSAERFGDAEVGHQRMRALRQDVGRLDIAMDDTPGVGKRLARQRCRAESASLRGR